MRNTAAMDCGRERGGSISQSALSDRESSEVTDSELTRRLDGQQQQQQQQRPRRRRIRRTRSVVRLGMK